MRKIAITAILTALMLTAAGSVFGFAKTDQDCSKCHTLSADQAKGILDDLIPKVKVLHVVPGPISGLWEIGVDMDGKKAIIYLDYAKKHIISPATRGDIINLQTKVDLTQESFQKINKVDVSKIPLKDSLLLGDKNAKHKVIVFDDPD